MTSNIIKFVRGNQIIQIHSPDTNETILNYIRTKLRKTGTKEGCAEGGCGACTIVLGELKKGKIIYKAINACIAFVPTLAGKQLVLVEDLVSDDDLYIRYRRQWLTITVHNVDSVHQDL